MATDRNFEENLATRITDVRLHGPVDENMLESLRGQLERLSNDDAAVVIELTTLGGGADMGRRIALEIATIRRRFDRRIVFLGKTAVYSAGVTIMAAFPQADRYLTSDAVLLIHCRQMESKIELSGPLRPSADRLRALLSEIEHGLRIEREDFEALIERSDITLSELLDRAPYNWYVSAEEASQRRLIASVV